MSRAVWTGMLSFGMVNIPSYLVAADDTAEEADQHAPNFEAIRESNRPKRDFKIHQFTQQQYFFKDLNELKSLAYSPKHVIQIQGFLSAQEFSTDCYDRSFMLLPESGGSEPLVLLIDALTEKELIGIGTIQMRNKPSMLAIEPRRGFLYAHTLLIPAQTAHSDVTEKLSTSLKEALKLFEAAVEQSDQPEHSTRV